MLDAVSKRQVLLSRHREDTLAGALTIAFDHLDCNVLREYGVCVILDFRSDGGVAISLGWGFNPQHDSVDCLNMRPAAFRDCFSQADLRDFCRLMSGILASEIESRRQLNSRGTWLVGDAIKRITK